MLRHGTQLPAPEVKHLRPAFCPGVSLLPKKEKKMKSKKVRVLTGCAMLTAVGVVLQYLEISIPIMPSFIKLDFSDLPQLIGAFAYGPAAGVIICLLRNLIHMAVSNSGFVGELSNFLMGATFALVAGLVYRRRKTKGGALLAGISGAAAMAAVCLPVNYFIIYPLYYNVMGLPREAVLDMYRLVIPGLESILKGILIFNVPFTLSKGLISTVISMIIYKPLSPLLKGKNSA